jgi:hypothetical protein
MRLKESYVIKALHDFIAQADPSELSTISDNIFGGKMFYRVLLDKKGNLLANQYEFEPDNRYWGAFDEYKDGE